MTLRCLKKNVFPLFQTHWQTVFMTLFQKKKCVGCRSFADKSRYNQISFIAINTPPIYANIKNTFSNIQFLSEANKHNLIKQQQYKAMAWLTILVLVYFACSIAEKKAICNFTLNSVK